MGLRSCTASLMLHLQTASCASSGQEKLTGCRIWAWWDAARSGSLLHLSQQPVQVCVRNLEQADLHSDSNAWSKQPQQACHIAV